MYAVECFVLFDDVSISKDQSQICHRGPVQNYAQEKRTASSHISQAFCLVISNTHYIIKGVLKDFRRSIIVPSKT